MTNRTRIGRVRRLNIFKAFLFDLDDTLVNTTQLIKLSMKKWCLENNVDFNLAIEKGSGARTEDTVAIVAPHLDAKKEAIKIESYENQMLEFIEPIPGAIGFLAKLSGRHWAVVTSSSHELATRKLKACQLPNPKILITGDCVTVGKPDPEPYLMAIETLGLNPEDCLVFEDSDNGVISADEAGCKIVLIGDKSVVKSQNIIARVHTYKQLELSVSGALSIETRYT